MKYKEKLGILIPQIKERVNQEGVRFAEEFGLYLGKDSDGLEKLTSSQLRKFFGEVKRQEMTGYNETDFILLKPKLAYTVGKDKGASKIKAFYEVIAYAIDQVGNEKEFKNFVKILEAIVAYHKQAEA